MKMPLDCLNEVRSELINWIKNDHKNMNKMFYDYGKLSIQLKLEFKKYKKLANLMFVLKAAQRWIMQASSITKTG